MTSSEALGLDTLNAPFRRGERGGQRRLMKDKEEKHELID